MHGSAAPCLRRVVVHGHFVFVSVLFVSALYTLLLIADLAILDLAIRLPVRNTTMVLQNPIASTACCAVVCRPVVYSVGGYTGRYSTGGIGRRQQPHHQGCGTLRGRG